MQKHKNDISINLNHIQDGLSLNITERKENSLFECDDASDYGEAFVQIKEGCFYDYEIEYKKQPELFELRSSSYIKPFIKKPQLGTLSPNIYVGTLDIPLYKKEGEDPFDVIKIEVQSVKSEYRTDYRNMIEDITEKCTDLIMQIDSPIRQNFETNFDVDSKTLYQRFSFVKSLIDSKEFDESAQKIISNPTTQWTIHIEERDIRSVKRFNQKSIRQLVSKRNRIQLKDDHFLNKTYGLPSIPTKIDGEHKTESIDTPENRFIKHALEVFLFFCESCQSKFKENTKSKLEAYSLSNKLSNLLNHSFFKDISRPNSLKLNSPVLQRKSGYRQVLNAWMKFDLAAKLSWEGGNNVYDAGKKDIATLYEYWVFFTLLEIIKDVFNIEPKSIDQLLKFSKDHIAVNLKQGNTIALDGIYKSKSRSLKIQFSYNRSFGGGKKYPQSGSYTTTLRPDYTLSIWPESLNKDEAEIKELITHIHFDAKYKVKNFYELVSTSKNEELSEEENLSLIKEEKKEKETGNYKNQDLLKMHAYKDAIRRTGGAYVLYPGKGENDPYRGFHELIPGLGAFVLKPNKESLDKKHVKEFIQKVIQNFNDRASQREKLSIKTFDIHKENKLDGNILEEFIPEYINGEKLIPDETYILVGYCKSNAHYTWYLENGLYNFRMNDSEGSLIMDENTVKAKYILLRKDGKAEEIYKIKSKGPKVFSKAKLLEIDYPNPTQDEYLLFEIEKERTFDFGNRSWNYKDLEKYKELKEIEKRPRVLAGIPFTVSIYDLMKVIQTPT
jgi:predicted component of viral defense system (DUF524 family)